MSEDARVVDVAVNGEIRFAGLVFGAVSAYETLPAGDYRIQFVESGSLSPSIFDTTVSLAPGDSVTVGIAGFDSSDLLRLRDERAASSSRAGLRFANAVPDFPRELDLAVLNGAVIASRVGYLGSAGYQDLIPGLYDLELLRTGTRDSAAESYGHSLTAGRNFTAFAIGTLRREDIEVIVVPDSDP
ncbi:MAG: DUF4397 domain-containing protein [Acidobacteria bacterium]|nr:DUF4397 domain-containing protein [Acidobacteriota bacterium]